MKKLIILLNLVFLLIVSNFALAGMPTQAQINRWCVQLRLKVDGDIHNFYIGNIISFDEYKITIRFGKYRKKRVSYPRSEMLNFEEAIAKYKKLGGK